MLAHSEPDRVLEDEVDQLVKEYPQSPDAWVTQGRVRCRRLDYEGAAQSFMAAIALDPANGHHYWELALAYRARDDNQAMALALEKALELGLDSPLSKSADLLLKAARAGRS
jgi:uncharacterized protein HemY